MKLVIQDEQLSIVIRYFDDTKCCAVEQFLSMKKIKSINAQSIFNTLSDVVEEYNINQENIVSTCFDGAATMADRTAGVQAKFEDIFCILLWPLFKSNFG